MVSVGLLRSFHSGRTGTDSGVKWRFPLPVILTGRQMLEIAMVSSGSGSLDPCLAEFSSIRLEGPNECSQDLGSELTVMVLWLP